MPGQIALEFTVVSEPWVKYKLEDQTKMFVKLVLVKVVRGFNEQGQPAYSVSTQNVISTHAPESLRGQPSTSPVNFADPSTFKVVASVDFDRVGPEAWNEYKLEDGTTLKARVEIATVMRTDKYLADGDPVYLTNAQALTRFKVADEVLKQASTIGLKRKSDTKGPYA